LLLEVAVVLVTSVAGLPATEVSSVPSLPLHSVVVTDSPAPFVGPVVDTAPSSSSATEASTALTATQSLSRLARIPADGISAFLSASPHVVDQLLAEQPSPHEVALWWGELDGDRQTALEAASPRLVGNLEGVPYTVRDLSNRAMLDEAMGQLSIMISSDVGRAVQQDARQQLNMLNSIAQSLELEHTGPARTLISLDVSGQGRAAIVLGDPSEADYVSYLVPGMFFTIENQMTYWVDAAHDLYDQQLQWLDHFEERSVFSHNESVATVAWIGYDTPNLTNVGAIDNALQGRDTLAQAIMGLQAQRGDDQPYISIVAHSYGSTAALMALSEYDFEVDALAIVGSPGSPAASIEELNVRDGNVFVGEAAWDPIPNSSYFGPDPGSKDFGARSLGVSGAFDIIMNQELSGSVGHNEYFQPGTEAMRNFALLSIGRSDLVIPETQSTVQRAFATPVSRQG